MTERPEANGEEMHKTLADADTAERFITEKHLGERIRRLRLKKSMGLVDLGKHTGLSASFLSQLETGRVVPTLRNLARIAMVFSKDLSYFFENEPAPIFRVHRKKDRVRMPQTGVEPPTYTFESLGYMVPDRHMDPYFAEFVPLPEQCGAQIAHARGIRVPIRARGRAGAAARRPGSCAGPRRRRLLRRRHAALLPLRRQQAGRGHHRHHASGAGRPTAAPAPAGRTGASSGVSRPCAESNRLRRQVERRNRAGNPLPSNRYFCSCTSAPLMSRTSTGPNPASFKAGSILARSPAVTITS